MERKSKEELLIKIILYLLLAIAFFSDYSTKSCVIDKPCNINFMIMTIFLFGIFALTFLYIGNYSDKDLNKAGKALGYVFAGSFILVFIWFILNLLTPIKKGEIIVSLLNLLNAQTIQVALLIPSIILVLYLIYKHK